MKKSFNLKRLAIITVILIIVSPFVYAISSNASIDNKFFRVDNTEIEVGETLTMTIDLSQIEYEDFKFILNSDISLSDVEVSTDNEENVETNNNQITITSSKSNINMDKIELYYKIPEDLELGTKITLKASIEENVEESEKDIIEEEIVVTIKETKVEENISNQGKENLTDIQDKTIQNNQDKTVQNSSSTQSVKTSSSTTGSFSSISGSSTTQAVTYKGSYDNYLTSIEVDGYDLTPEFSKTNTTYFLTVDNSVTSLSISVTRSDSSAQVTVYGNTDLKEGSNKVLISVTAENGDVRTYRIYVTREA